MKLEGVVCCRVEAVGEGAWRDEWAEMGASEARGHG